MRKKYTTNCMLISNTSKPDLPKITNTFNNSRICNQADIGRYHEEKEIFLQNKRKKTNEKNEKNEIISNKFSLKFDNSFTYDKCLNLFGKNEFKTFLEEDIKIRKDPEKLKQLNIEVITQN